MTSTQAVIDEYFRRLKDKADWSTCLADDMVFTSFTSPSKRVEGKAAYLDATKRFYSTIATTKVKSVLVDGANACALTHYDLRAPGLPPFGTDVAEVFQVRGGKIAAFDIYFDATPFPK